MRVIDGLRAKAQQGVARQQELLSAAATANRDLTAEEQTEFDALEASVEANMKSISRLQGVNDKAAALANGARTDAANPPANNAVDLVVHNDRNITVGRKLTGIEMVGICAWAAARAKHYTSKPALTHLEEAGFQQIADTCRKTRDDMVREKTFNSITAGTGDNSIVTPLSTDFIETLRNESVFLSSGPVPVDLSYGKLDIPGGNVGATGTYTAEGSDLGYTQMSTRKVSLSAKHLGAVTAVGNYNIEISPLAIASIVGDDLQMGIMLAMDASGLRGDGVGNNPAGLLSLINASHKFASAALVVAPTIAQVDFDAKLMLTKIRGSNVPARRRRWLMANRVFTYLQFMRDANSNLVWPSLSLPNPTWYGGYPVSLSEQIPTTLGATTNESEIYLADFGHILMGEARAVVLKSSTEASYKNGGGTLVSAFSLDETVIRATCSHDFDMRHDKSSVILTQVRWGA